MAKEFTHTAIGLCGEEYYFKRCSNETLKKFDEEMEAKIKEIEPLTRESELLNKNGEKIEKQIESKERRIRLLEEKGDEEDIDTILKLQDDLDKLLEKQEKHLEEVRKFIGEGHGHFEEYVGFYTNDDVYTVAFYYLDKP